MRIPSIRVFLGAAGVVAVAAGPAGAQEQTSRCAGLVRDTAGTYVALPDGDVFCPLVADPKAVRSFVSYLHGDEVPFDTEIGAVGVGDRFGLLRVGGFQLSLEGAIFAQFDLQAASFDLINSDYVLSVPLTFRWGDSGARIRLYHQSSHLGDEYVLASQEPERENLSFESLEAILSRFVGPLRVYGGGEYLFNRNPDDLERFVAHGGVEIRPTPPLWSLGRLGTSRFVAGVDMKASEEQDWSPAWSVRAGFEFGRPVAADPAPRRWGILAEYYQGPTPYGQFFRADLSYYGIGAHFTF